MTNSVVECCVRFASWLQTLTACVWLFTPHALGLIGLGLSLFLGTKAPSIFWSDEDRAKFRTRSGGRLYWFWLNFMGSALGWALFILLVLLLPRLDPKDPPWVYVVLLPLAVFGMAGVLPWVILSVTKGGGSLFPDG